LKSGQQTHHVIGGGGLIGRKKSRRVARQAFLGASRSRENHACAGEQETNGNKSQDGLCLRKPTTTGGSTPLPNPPRHPSPAI
jgi:hypothetical protein